MLRSAAIPLLLLASATAQSILGFTPASAARETVIESKFKSIPTPDEERRQHRIFTQEPHVAGSKRNNELAEYIRDEWQKQGLEDVIIRRYDVYGTNPKHAELEMIAPTKYTALLRETPLPEMTTPKIPPSAARGPACRSPAKSPRRSSTRTAAIPKTTTCSEEMAST